MILIIRDGEKVALQAIKETCRTRDRVAEAPPLYLYDTIQALIAKIEEQDRLLKGIENATFNGRKFTKNEGSNGENSQNFSQAVTK